MARILAITNQKGGVGKTTTAINLAACLAAAELPTLLVDCDPQGNASSGVGVARQSVATSLYHVIMGYVPAATVLLPTPLQGLQVLPASRDLVGVNLELVSVAGRESRLRQALRPVKDQFEFLILDCPPALDLLTVNALVAADAVIVPMQCEYFALEGISQLLETIAAVQSAWNPGLLIEGILFNQFDERTNLSRQVAEDLRLHFGAQIFTTTIPRNIRLAEAPSFGQPVLLYDVRSRGSEAYLQLAREVIEREQQLRESAAQSLGARA